MNTSNTSLSAVAAHNQKTWGQQVVLTWKRMPTKNRLIAIVGGVILSPVIVLAAIAVGALAVVGLMGKI